MKARHMESRVANSSSLDTYHRPRTALPRRTSSTFSTHRPCHSTVSSLSTPAIPISTIAAASTAFCIAGPTRPMMLEVKDEVRTTPGRTTTDGMSGWEKVSVRTRSSFWPCEALPSPVGSVEDDVSLLCRCDRMGSPGLSALDPRTRATGTDPSPQALR
jgi:hypothetical protein